MVDYLKSEKERVAYLKACMEKAGDDATFIAQALGNIARARGMAQLTKDTSLTRAGLYKSLGKNSNPSFGTILKVVKALRVKLTPRAT